MTRTLTIAALLPALGAATAAWAQPVPPQQAPGQAPYPAPSHARQLSWPGRPAAHPTNPPAPDWTRAPADSFAPPQQVVADTPTYAARPPIIPHGGYSWRPYTPPAVDDGRQPSPTPEFRPVTSHPDAAWRPYVSPPAETPAPELPRAFRARAERKRRTRQAAAAGAAWAAAAAVVLGLITGGVLFREEIVRKFPATAGAYGALGLDVNIVGLEFEAQRARVAPHDPGRIVVSGAVRNIRETEVSSPPIRVILQDERGVEIASRVVRPDWPPILPGKVEGFATVIADPQGKAAGMTTKFILEPARKAPPRPADKKARPEPAAREDGGLRRLGALDLGPTPAPLDTDVADGVSARHG